MNSEASPSPPPTSVARQWRLPVWCDVGVIIFTAIFTGGLMILAKASLNSLYVSLIGAWTFGLTATLVASAWGMAIAFQESARHGLWFAFFPPYMAWYAICRWPEMRSAAILFLSGLVVMTTVTYFDWLLLQELAAHSADEGRTLFQGQNELADRESPSF